MINDTTRVTKPPVIYFYSHAEPKEKIIQSSINIKQKGKNLRDPKWFKGPPMEVFRWRIREKEIPVEEYPVLYYLFAKAEKSGESPVKKMDVIEYTIEKKEKMRIDRKEFSRYSLIRFDFGSEELRKMHLKLLGSIVETENRNNSTRYYLSGYTDKTGAAEQNMELSTNRAASIADNLAKLGIEKNQIAKVKGFGESKSPYYNSAISKLIVSQGRYIDPEIESTINESIVIDYNSYPEGRFLCRTVVIEIENTINE
jgi:outer membrane protein OmpA-like peptidoglycan-associated protein